MIPLRPPLRPRDWLVVVAATVLVLKLASLVSGKEPPAFDEQMLTWIGTCGQPWCRSIG
jgi:hypothetical protein